MTLEADIYTGLTGHAGLAALVATRIYRLEFPAGTTLPCVTYQLIAYPREQGVPANVLGGSALYQLSGWSEDRTQAEALGVQLVAAAVALAGTVADVTVVDERSGHEPDAGLWRRDVDVRLLVAA